MSKYIKFLLLPIMLFGVSGNYSYSMDIQNNKPRSDVMFSEVIDVISWCDAELLGCMKEDGYTFEEKFPRLLNILGNGICKILNKYESNLYDEFRDIYIIFGKTYESIRKFLKDNDCFRDKYEDKFIPNYLKTYVEILHAINNGFLNCNLKQGISEMAKIVISNLDDVILMLEQIMQDPKIYGVEEIIQYIEESISKLKNKMDGFKVREIIRNGREEYGRGI